VQVELDAVHRGGNGATQQTRGPPSSGQSDEWCVHLVMLRGRVAHVGTQVLEA